MKKRIPLKFMLILSILFFAATVNSQTIQTSLETITSNDNSTVNVDIIATNVVDVDALQLSFFFDDAVLSNFSVVSTNVALPNDFVNGMFSSSATATKVSISWIRFGSYLATFAPNDSVLATLSFTFATGASNLIWDDLTVDACKFTGGDPSATLSSEFIDGKITSVNALAISAEPQANDVCAGYDADFSITASATSYQWRMSTDNGETWANVVNGAQYAGATTNTLTVTTLESMDKDMFVCLLDDGLATENTSNTALLTVNGWLTPPTIDIAVDPGTEICDGVNTTFSLSSTGGIANPIYTWKLNNVEVGTDSTYISAALVDNDVITCELSSSTACILSDPDTETMTVNPYPAAAVTPTGDVTLCQNSANSVYTTTAVNDAVGYFWVVSPSNAGTFTSDSTLGLSNTIDWDDTYAGQVSITVKAYNDCGYGTVSSGLTVEINSVPDKAATPAGSTSLCIDNANTSFTTTGAVNATSYSWGITNGAGTFTGATDQTTIELDWENTFSGTAQIWVIGVNACGSGANSDTLEIIVTPLPGVPATPTGDVSLCENNANTDYTTTGANEALNYTWDIIPGAAGIISGTGLTATVNWDDSYVGDAKVAVKGVNTCGEGSYSDSLIITISALPGKAATPTGTNDLCQDAVNTDYTTTGATNATTYVWDISPVNAGTITGTGMTGTVDWDENFNGIATISVKGQACGDGEFSDGFDVTVNTLPSKAGTPTGITNLCQGNTSENYSTSGSINADSYYWLIEPTAAGTITGTTQFAVANWSTEFSGTAYITVRGVSTCGDGNFSDSLEITINSIPSIDLGDSIITFSTDTVVVDVGTGYDSYVWSEGSINTSPNITTYGFYTVTVNVNSCENSDSIEIIQPETQTIPLGLDWSMISTYIDPTFDNFHKMMNTVSDNVFVAKDELGLVYMPGYGVYQIGNHIVGKAYQIKLNVADTLIVEGLTVTPENTNVSLLSGWTLFGYLRTSEASMVDMLSDVVNDIVIVKDDQGQVYWPFFTFNNIGNMIPGEGYQANTTAQIDFAYVANSAKCGIHNCDNEQAQHFTNQYNTGCNMTVCIPSTAWDNYPQESDEVGIFTKNGLLVGSALCNSDNIVCTIWGDDPYTDGINGMLENEEYIIKLWNSDLQIEEIIKVDNWIEGNELYKTNKIAIANKISIINSETNNNILYQNTPNPFDNSTEIHFYLGENSFVKIQVYNLLGEFVQELVSSDLQAGEHTIIFNSQNIEAGTYMYKITTSNFVDTKYMNIVK